MTPVPSELLALAAAAADAAGRVLMRHWRRPVATELKADGSPVTAADREAEAAIRKTILARRPRDGISGEELGSVNEGADWLWLVDPLDGTRSFMKGKASFGVLIGLVHEGRHVLGVIEHPATGDRWIGALGHGTRHNGEAVATRPCPSLGEAVAAMVGPEREHEDDEPALGSLRRAVRRRLYGLEAMAYGLLACGRIDLALDGVLDRHDIAALVPVVAQAGGVLSDRRGQPVTPDTRGPIVAAGDPRLHALALEAMAGSGT